MITYVLAHASEAKYLGFTLNQNLNFNKHIDITCKIANASLAFIRCNTSIATCRHAAIEACSYSICMYIYACRAFSSCDPNCIIPPYTSTYTISVTQPRHKCTSIRNMSLKPSYAKDLDKGTKACYKDNTYL